MTRGELWEWLKQFEGQPNTPELRLHIERRLHEVFPVSVSFEVIAAPDGSLTVLVGAAGSGQEGMNLPMAQPQPLPTPSRRLPDPSPAEMREAVESAEREVARLPD